MNAGDAVYSIDYGLCRFVRHYTRSKRFLIIDPDGREYLVRPDDTMPVTVAVVKEWESERRKKGLKVW